MKLAELAQKLNCRLEGPAELEISGVAGMEHAEPGQLTGGREIRSVRSN